MKRRIITVAAIAAISITSFFACKKSSNTSGHASRIEASTLSTLSEELDAIRTNSYTMHNDYMQAAYNAYVSNDLSTAYTLTNLNSQLTWSENFLSDYITENSVQSEWTSIKNDAINNYNSSNLAITNSFLNYQGLSTSDYKNYLSEIVNALEGIDAQGESIDFLAVCANVYNNMKTDNNLSVTEKEILAAIVGVAEGSYAYWDNNVEAWMQLASIPANLPNLPQNGGPTLRLSQKEGQVIGFVAADCMGALDGGAAGSVLPGVGTAAGAVMGAALYSGLTAWFW